MTAARGGLREVENADDARWFIGAVPPCPTCRVHGADPLGCPRRPREHGDRGYLNLDRIAGIRLRVEDPRGHWPQWAIEVYRVAVEAGVPCDVVAVDPG